MQHMEQQRLLDALSKSVPSPSARAARVLSRRLRARRSTALAEAVAFKKKAAPGSKERGGGR
jgi:hypothetical protein